jgi:hypothetical protein
MLQPEVVAKTANFTLDMSQVRSGAVFTNRGAGGAVTMTLPTPSASIRRWRGYTVYLQGVADQNIAIAAAANKAVCKNNATATSLTASTSSEKIGALLRAVWDGTSWCLTAIQGTGTVA